MTTKTKNGFTLIELLVVISVIGLLASVVLIALNSVRAKARDAKRSADIRQLATVIQLYFDDNNAFPTNTGCLNGWCCLGHGDASTCWASGGYYGSTALDNSLSPKYLSKIPDDPLNNTATYGDAYMYMNDGPSARLHWGLENVSPTAEKDCLGGHWGIGAPVMG